MKLSDLKNTQVEAKQKPQVPAVTRPSTPEQSKLVIEECPMYKESLNEKIISNPEIVSKIKEFISFKKSNPLGQFGKTDKRSPTGTPFENLVPGVRHAHLTFDISVWYKIVGSNPSVLKLYGIFTHDETGTGQPTKVAKARTVASRMAQQADKFSPA